MSPLPFFFKILIMHLFLFEVIPESLWRTVSPFVLPSTRMHILTRGPQTTLFDDSLAGLTGLRKAIMLIVMVSYSERLRLK